ncbi:uncharacterized protein K452DRAFT_226223 [Aplosporella prunicola CBS 121167]|uniref:25S rRNA (uridine-N(3))-methyltransferase BMT5-like domain-containing protein n=1 Tax=Aplosporella prunicola CBS 121167 TaxID=1176127 RepID=A0A6A6BHW5_9PEZI|nr:uncharacterized protein K452DRAFT_226223 [Aplosporella prunicola CBS 121167]KAF2142935.1 hypothetical protein K452DRAFT_226223 [Aplosporella prunicola CBS 121167]
MGRANRVAREAEATPPSKKQKKSNDANPTAENSQQQQQQQQQQQRAQPTIPFEANDRILLVGEGDFSFAHSLVEHHGAAALLATAFDTRETVLEKYPQAAQTMAGIEAEAQRVLCGVDATKLDAHKTVRRGLPADGYGWASADEMAEGAGAWDRIVFNFPHVGGKSTDVNRQVRYNQELLVSFFTSAIPLLAPTGTIVVTIFDGEPYTLWNVRDLARHAGLAVERSFRFDAAAYPGYAHARTLGNVEGHGSAWKGENRPARSYVFCLPEAKLAAEGGGAKKKKGGVASGGSGAAAAAAGKGAKDAKQQGKKRKKGGEDSSDDED